MLQTAETIFIDIETNGLDPSVIWCVCVSVYRGDELRVSRTFSDSGEFADFIDSRKQGTSLVAHNGLCFDFPVLEQLWGVDLSGFNLVDTLTLSRLSQPSRVKPEGMRENKPHSLEAWGIRLGFPKGDHDDWSCLSPEMIKYCQRDVEILRAAYVAIMKELNGFEPQSITLEHEVASIIGRQVDLGWKLNVRAAYLLLAELRERELQLEDEVHERFIPMVHKVREIIPKIKNDGKLSAVGIKFLGESCTTLVGGAFTRVDYPDFNLGSRKQIGKYLQHFGWKPKQFTPKGQPIVDETVLEGVDIPEAQLIAEYLTVGKRVAMIQSWVDSVDEDDRVHGYVNSNGAVTGRMTHSDPNVAQVPAKGKPYGEECRALWTVKEGYKLVGADASGLELRMLAHYMNDPEFTHAVCEGREEDGTDIHTVNQRRAGLATRRQAKTFIYAFLYGAGDGKIGEIVGGDKQDGARLKAKFLKATPALQKLRGRVEVASRRGWLKGLDGRRVAVRSTYAALNTLLQSAGAVVMKQALVLHMEEVAKQHLVGAPVGNIHDEIQSEVLGEHARQWGQSVVRSIVYAGEHFNLRCPLDGAYKIGNNWAQTH